MNDATSNARVSSVLEDPHARAIAKVYSDAFHGAIGDGDVAGHLEELSSFIEDVVEAHPDFSKILLSQMISKDDKVALLERVLPGHGSEMLLSFLRVLARHDRLDLLPIIADEAQLEFEKVSGRGRVQVTTAKPLSDDRLQNITQSLKSKLSFDPIIETRVDPTVLGGLVIQIGNVIHDGSIKSKLKSLRGRLQQRSLHEIQSGRDRFSTSEGN